MEYMEKISVSKTLFQNNFKRKVSTNVIPRNYKTKGKNLYEIIFLWLHFNIQKFCNKINNWRLFD